MPRMRHTPAAGRSARRGGGPHTLKSTAPREWAWTWRSARAELGKPLRGFPHAHPRSDDYGGALRFWDKTDPTKTRAAGGLMVVMIAWPNAHDERQDAC